MVIASHVVFSAYGFWLPNDPRGSLSRELRVEELGELGEIHCGRKPVQPRKPELQRFHREAQKILKYPVIWFDPPLRERIARAFGELIRREKLTCYACAVLNNHAHLLIRRHKLRAQEMIPLLRDHSRSASHDLIPPSHPLWSLDPYMAYKDNPHAVRSAIDYICSNYAKHNLPPPEFDFVVGYDGWFRTVKPVNTAPGRSGRTAT